MIEVFGYSPHAGLPDTHIYTFASTLHNRDTPEKYVSTAAYDNYLANNPHNESRFVFPIEEGSWQDPESCDFIAEDSKDILVRGRALKLPPVDEYGRHGIEVQQPPRIHVFELCRYLADAGRERLLGESKERRISLFPDLRQILPLEEWNHPNLLEGELREAVAQPVFWPIESTT